MAESKDPLREQFTAGRRAQILDGAARVFAEKGYHNATNKDIAEAAGVSYGTIYHYFESKADLLIGILNQLDEMELRGEQLEAGLQVSFEEALIAFLQRHAALYLPNMTMFRAILPEVLVNAELRDLYYTQNVLPTREMLEAHLQARADRGELRAINVKLAAGNLLAMLMGSMLLHVLGDVQPGLEPGNLFAEVADLIVGGMKKPEDTS